MKIQPTCPRKPRSQSTTRMTIIVQSMGFVSVNLNPCGAPRNRHTAEAIATIRLTITKGPASSQLVLPLVVRGRITLTKSTIEEAARTMLLMIMCHFGPALGPARDFFARFSFLGLLIYRLSHLLQFRRCGSSRRHFF